MMIPIGKRGLWITAIGGTLILFALIFQLFLKPALDRSARLDRLLPEKAKRLSEIREMAAQYKSLKANQKDVAESIQKAAKRSLLSELEGFAMKANVKEKIASMKPSKSIISDMYQEEAIEVEFREVELNQVLKVLHQIEYSSHIMGVKWIRIKSLSTGEGFLNATFKVFTLEQR